MNRTLMVSSVEDHPVDNDILSFGGIDRVYVNDWQPTEHKQVYFRAGYETELDSPILIKINQIEEYYAGQKATMFNEPSVTFPWHRKDIWYVTEWEIAPPCLPNPTINECLVSRTYPRILRRADSAGGLEVHLVFSEAEMRIAHASLLGKRTVLVEFIEDRVGEYWGLLQAWVVGSKMFCYHRAVHTSWKWDRTKNAHLEAAYKKENKSFKLSEKLSKMIMRPYMANRLSVYSIEILLGKDGPVVIDVNPMAQHTLEGEKTAPFKAGLIERIHDYIC